MSGDCASPSANSQAHKAPINRLAPSGLTPFVWRRILAAGVGLTPAGTQVTIAETRDMQRQVFAYYWSLINLHPAN